MTDIKLPLIINGDARYGDETSLDFDRGEKIRVLLPKITAKDVEEVAKCQRDLHMLSIEDIISFLSKLGKLWQDERYELRKEALELLEKTTGYHRKELELDYQFWMSTFDKQFLEQTIEAELRSKQFLEGWMRIKNVEVRAFPQGRVLHILAGNFPGVGIVSLTRGLLTKNTNILKLASGEPISITYLALSLIDVDPNHPITKTTSVVYWEHDSDAENKAFEIADAICAWGGYESVYSARKKSRPRQPILEYGPKRSMHFIDKESIEDDTKLKEITARAAHDIALHDQQACHSPQVAFVEKHAEKFCEALAKSLSEEGKNLPKGYVSIDEHARISHVRSMSLFRGDKVYRPDSTEWTIILTNDFGRTTEHPLSRTLYVIQVNDLKEAVKFADPLTMVIGFSSSKRIEELRDELALRGVDRITEVGRMGYFPVGFPHEGRFDLSNLVRWVSRDIV
jgi:long-chain-fatty-acyl-CoA reductase